MTFWEILFHIVAWPVDLIDWMFRDVGGIFGGDLFAFFSSAILEALWISLITVLILINMIL